MPGQNLLQFIGGGPQKQTRFVSLFTSRFLIGLYTNKSPLRGPLDSVSSEFYHMGATDTLIDGLNTELSVRSTIIRRPGNPKFSTATTTDAVDSFYSFHQSDGTIQVIGDGPTDVEVITPTAYSPFFTKSAGAGLGYFQGIDKSLYISDGVDLIKYIPSGNDNPDTGQKLWNWGGAAPAAAPTLVVTESGSTAVAWNASTFFSTMGVVVDPTTNVAFQLINVNADGTNPNTQIGTSGAGAPAFSTIPGGTVSDGSVTWTCITPIGVWRPNATILTGFAGIDTSGGQFGSDDHPAMIYDAQTGGFYANSKRGVSGFFTTGPTRPNFDGIVGHNNMEPSTGGTECNWVCYANAFNPSGNTDLRYGSPMFVWQANHVYATSVSQPNANLITPNPPPPLGTPYPTNVKIYYQASGGGTSQATPYNPWGTTPAPANNVQTDGQLQWVSLGSSIWTAATAARSWTQSNDTDFSCVIDAVGCLQVCTQDGVTGAFAPWIIWVAAATHIVGDTITDTNGNLQIVTAITTGISAGSITWTNTTKGTTLVDGGVTWTNNGPAYGSTTPDGNTVVWTNVGLAVGAVWAASALFYLPKSGFFAPSAANPYGGADIVDSNVKVEFVINSGRSKTAPHPVWNVAGAGSLTTDGTVLWLDNGSPISNSFSWTSGFGYCYSFKARRSSDVYVSTVPPLWTAVLGPPTGAGDGTVTTASPVVQLVGANAGAVVRVTGFGSTDPQFDTIEIFRSTDGFGAGGPYLFLTDIPMPSPIGPGVPGTWSLEDFMPDVASATLPGLDPLIVAPIAHQNDPPPGQFGSLQFVQSSTSTPTVAAPGTGLIGQVYHQGRLWGFIGNTAFASGGPDTIPGNGFTAWPPDQAFPFDSQVVKLLSTTAGLFVFTTTDVGLIGGGPSITAYESQVIFPGIGILSPNAVTTIAGVPYLFSSDRQLLGLDPAGGITRIAHNIGDQLANFDPSTVYLTNHHYGDLDNAIFISDGANQWFRCDINMAPDGKYTGPVWSPKATIAGGFKAVQSIETSPGVRELLIGPPAAGFILARDSTFTNFEDNGAPYDSYLTFGCLVLAHPGQLAQVAFVEMDFMKRGDQPIVSVLFDEVAATGGAAFEVISNSFISDPPKMFGPTAEPDTLWMNRFYLGQTTPGNTDQVPLPAWCKFLQLRVDFGNTNIVQNELLAFTIFGSLWQDK